MKKNKKEKNQKKEMYQFLEKIDSGKKLSRKERNILVNLFSAYSENKLNLKNVLYLVANVAAKIGISLLLEEIIFSNNKDLKDLKVLKNEIESILGDEIHFLK